MRSPVALIILDGWGLCDDRATSAIHCANTPVFDRLWRDWPHTELRADGEAVGLMPGQMGDSNVGHLNLGAGRIVYQDLTRIFKSIDDGDFFVNPVLAHAIDSAKDRGSTLHLMGLLSDGGVHSHELHCHALLEMAARRGLTDVAVHCFLDGRDVPPKSALGFIERLEEAFVSKGVGRVATLMGRYYPMDRDRRWDRVQKAYDAMIGLPALTAPTASAALLAAYERGETDEFVLPTAIVGKDAKPIAVKPGDSIIFYNFRADRARQITRAFIDPDLTELNRPHGAFDLSYVGMAQYDATIPMPVAFPPLSLPNIFGEVISRAGLRQLRIAETEKYAHVTFFFNGLREEPFWGEDRVLIPSPKVATYDLMPEMSALKVAQEASRRITSGEYDCIVLNFANADMVGHTGQMEACTLAVQTVDRALGIVMDALMQKRGAALIVADHGNAEQMSDAAGGPHTAHTNNPVPCILVDPNRRDVRLERGILANVAPTLLQMLGIEQPVEMDQPSLIRKPKEVI